MRKPTILIADDDPTFTGLLVDMLETQGFTTFDVADGQRALDAIARLRPDLVILDVVMPGYSGMDVLCAIRSTAETRFTPVIMVSANNDPTSIWVGLRHGCDAYVTKPFQPREITSAVRRLLGVTAA